MNEIFDIKVTDKIEMTSRYNFNKELDVIIYNSNKSELYRTKFPFLRDITYWIGISQLKNIIVHIVDEGSIIQIFENINDFAYITCGDLFYMDLIEKLVISLLNVSDKKIIVYGINCKVPFDYPNLIKREFASPITSVHDKWFWKQQTCIEALKENFSNYVWMDGDIIANTNIDTISNQFHRIINYPIGEIHVQDEQILTKDGNSQLLGEKICEHFGINRKVIPKDLHACFFVYNSNCKWFFEEILYLYHTIYDQGLYDKLLGWNDESLHNFMQSKYGFTETLPLSNLALLCPHSKHESNPKVLRLFYGYWNENSPNNFGEVFGWSYVPEDKNQILYFHENKNLKDADEMIEYVKMKKNSSFNSSKWFFIDKYKLHNFEKERLKNDLELKYFECPSFEYKDLLNLNPNDVVVDIGAGVGFFERYSYLKNASKIICFEPDKNKFELLRLNAYKDSILFNADVINFVGEYNSISTYSIDYLFKTEIIDKIDVLKIDSEGKEELILLGINDSNLQNINNISIKWYNFPELDENKRNDIVNSYLRRGFNCFVNNDVNFTKLYFYKKKASTLIKKMFIDEDATILIDEDATKQLVKINDKRYLENINNGIIKVDNNRWLEAQSYEKKMWLNNLNLVSDDRNYDHLNNFDNYSFLNDFNKNDLSIIELGCGPFTNLRLIIEKIKGTITEIDLLDPLIYSYLNHQNCTYKNSNLQNHKVNLIESSIEDYVFGKKYDIVVMLNVLEHCMDIDFIFKKIKVILKDDGLFIFGDCCIKNEMISDLINNLYDTGHPLRITESKLDSYIDEYDDKIFYNKLIDQYDQPWRVDKYAVLRKFKKKVISFSVYGDSPKYTIGLLKNLELVQSIYPGWSVYVYYNNTVPVDIIETARQFKFVEFFDMTNENMPGMFWRFLPKDVELFISRDTDSRLSMREKNAVDEWIKSGKSLHIMRDHPVWHNVKMFGGMFGLIVKEDLKPNIEKWLENRDRSLFNRGSDCDFLFEEIYDKYLINNDIIAHDSYFNFPLSLPFPSKLEDYRFIGEIFDENNNRQEHYKDWIDKQESTNDLCLYIYHHLGMGDHFACNAIVRNYSKLYDKLFLFVKPANYENVKFMYKDLANIKYLVGDDNFAESIISNKKNALKINCVGKELDCNFDEYFYRSINMDFEKMWSDYYVERDIRSEKALFDKFNLVENEYIFIQEDASRNLLMDRSKLRTDLRILESDIQYNIFDYQYILENAREIHLMESSYKCLVDHLNIKGVLYFHKYMRDYPKYIESTIRNIKMITYE